MKIWLLSGIGLSVFSTIFLFLAFWTRTINPHTYFNMACNVQDISLGFAERLIERGIEVNTVENLRQLNPDRSAVGIAHQQKLEFGWLYSQYAWVLWQGKRFEQAFDAATRAMEFKSQSYKPDAADVLRLGIIAFDVGKKQAGWGHLCRAFLMDTEIEHREAEYEASISRIVKDRFGVDRDPADFIADYRSRHAVLAPDLSLVTLENASFRLEMLRGRVLFVQFFSPACGSCREEISNLVSLYQAFSSREDVAFLFILNQPRLKQEALDLFERYSIKEPIVVVLADGSAYDLISAEPSTWIVDRNGKVVSRVTGYRQGDELHFHKQLAKLVQN